MQRCRLGCRTTKGHRGTKGRCYSPRPKGTRTENDAMETGGSLRHGRAVSSKALCPGDLCTLRLHPAPRRPRGASLPSLPLLPPHPPTGCAKLATSKGNPRDPVIHRSQPPRPRTWQKRAERGSGEAKSTPGSQPPSSSYSSNKNPSN